jgi:type II secretory pathway component PulF
MLRSSRRATLYTKLTTLVGAGIPLLRALDTASGGEPGKVRRALADIRQSVSRGMGLAEAMGQHGALFGTFDRVLIEAADTSGNLETCFKMLADWYQFLHRMQNIVLTGLVLPLACLHIMAFILPIPSLVLGQVSLWRYLVAVATTLSGFYGLVALIAAVAWLTPRWARLRFVLDVIVLWIPVLGRGIRELSISRFSRAFNMLYKAGVPITQCFEKAPQVAGNARVAALFEGGARAASQGRQASEGFSRSLASEYRDLWHIGEESGRLDHSVDKIAEMSADRADLWLTQFARWLPRVVYFLIMVRMASQVLRMAGQIGSAYNIGDW